MVRLECTDTMLVQNTRRPPHRKALHFVLCIKVLHNVTPIDLLAQSAILLRLPPLHRRGINSYKFARNR